MIKFLGLVAITLVCFVVAFGITVIAACFVPDAIREWKKAFKGYFKERKEAKSKARAKTMAKVIPISSGMYTYNRQRKLVNMSEARVARR
jgi:hypothetical protein